MQSQTSHVYSCPNVRNLTTLASIFDIIRDKLTEVIFYIFRRSFPCRNSCTSKKFAHMVDVWLDIGQDRTIE